MSGLLTIVLPEYNRRPGGPAPAAATRAGTAPGWPADAGRARGRARDLVSARRAPWRLLRPRHTPACSGGNPAPRAPAPCCCHPCRHGTRLARRRRQSKGPGRETWSVHAGPAGASSGRATPLHARWAIRRPGALLLLLPLVPARHPAGPPTPAEQGAGARDLVSARRAPWRLLRPCHTPACSVAIRRPGALLLLLPPVPRRHPAGPPTPQSKGAGARDLVSARRARWRLLRPRHTPACSVAIRRPGALLLLLPPVPAGHSAGTPTPAEQRAGQEDLVSARRAPWRLLRPRHTPACSGGNPAPRGPAPAAATRAGHGTRLARRRRQSKGPGERLGQCTPGPLAPPQAAPHPLLARWQSGAQGPCSCCCHPVPARHPAGPPTPAEQGECTSSFCSGMAVAFRLRRIQYTREGGLTSHDLVHLILGNYGISEHANCRTITAQTSCQ